MMKKFRKNNWDDDQEGVPDKGRPKKKKLDRALKTKDIEYLNEHYDDDDWDY